MHLREAVPEDASLISRIIAASWRDAYQEIIDPVYLSRLPEEYWLPTMRAWLESGRMYGIIAEEAEKAVGCIIYGRGRDEAYADWGEIVSLYILPENTSRGIGSMLLSTALESLLEDGFSKVYLWVIQANHRAERFYLQHGFQPAGEQVKYRIGSNEVIDLRLAREG